MLFRRVVFPNFCEPCLPSPAAKPPAGAAWLHEIIEALKAALAKLMRRAKTGLVLNEHIDEPGDVVFCHACKLGLEGIVSKRRGSPYRSGRLQHWLKSKNPAAPSSQASGEVP